MKKYLALWIAAVLLSVFLAGCGEDTVEEPPILSSNKAPLQNGDLELSNPAGDTWTVLVYLCGTDLESDGAYASVNVAEMCLARQSDQVNIIIETGGTRQWAIEGIDPDKCQRWKVIPEDIELVESLPSANMGEADTLGDFLSWGVRAYPADKYMCLLWNHGGGSVTGIALDERYNADMLNLKELSQGVAMAGVQFELVGFDACLMSTMETAAAITPWARYMVASQELEPGTGWDYTDWLSFIADNPSADGLVVGRRICDGFYAKCEAEGMESLATLAVTDLSRLPALANAFDAMAAEMKGFTTQTDKLRPLTQAIVRAENYGGNNDSEGYTNMVDLGDLTLCAEGVVSETGDVVMAALTEAVPYSVAGAGRQRGHGLSVYVPLVMDEDELDRYARLAATSGEYLRFIEGLYDWTVPEGVTVRQTVYPGGEQPAEMQSAAELLSVDRVERAQALDSNDFTVEFSTKLTDDGSFFLTLDRDSDVVSTVAFNLYYEDEESNSLWYLGSDFDINQNDTGTVFWDNYRNTWTIINDNLCMMVALGFTDDYILYTVPVQVNGSDTNLRLLYHQDSGEYEVIGIWDGLEAESGMASRDIKKLADGDEVEFIFDAADLDSGEDASFIGGGFTVSGPVTVQEAELFDGTYYYEYEITDIFGNTYESDFAILTVTDGEMTISL